LAGRAMSGPCSCANATDRNKVQMKIAKNATVERRYMRVSLSFKGGRLAADKRLIDPKRRILQESSEERRGSARREALCQVVLLDLVSQLVAADAQYPRGACLITAGVGESLLHHLPLLLVEG